MNLLVCDDDPGLRWHLIELLRDHGHVVVGEAETSIEAEACIERLSPEGVIVDLSLRYGTGIEVLEFAQDHGCRPIVFTSFDAPPELPGNPAVVAKPDFVGLLEAVDALAASDDGESPDRRRSSPRSDPERLPGGIDEPHVFFDVVSRAMPGDILVALDLGSADGADALCGTARQVLRAQDRIMATATGATVLLIGPGDGAVAAVEDRIHAASGDAFDTADLAVRSVTLEPGEFPTDAHERLLASRRG